MADRNARPRELRQRIRDGERLIGTFLKARDAAVAETVAVAGYDFVVADLEHPGELEHPSVTEAITRAADSVLGGGIPLGMFFPGAEAAQQCAGLYARRGMTLLVISTDLSMLGAAARSALAVLREP